MGDYLRLVLEYAKIYLECRQNLREHNRKEVMRTGVKKDSAAKGTCSQT